MVQNITGNMACEIEQFIWPPIWWPLFIYRTHDLPYTTKEIGNRLLAIRKKYGMTQNEVAEASGLANRTYADIERGSVSLKQRSRGQPINKGHSKQTI